MCILFNLVFETLENHSIETFYYFSQLLHILFEVYLVSCFIKQCFEWAVFPFLLNPWLESTLKPILNYPQSHFISHFHLIYHHLCFSSSYFSFSFFSYFHPQILIQKVIKFRVFLIQIWSPLWRRKLRCSLKLIFMKHILIWKCLGLYLIQPHYLRVLFVLL